MITKLLYKNGWQITSPLDALQNKIGKRLPNTLHNAQGHVAALAAEKVEELYQSIT